MRLRLGEGSQPAAALVVFVLQGGSGRFVGGRRLEIPGGRLLSKCEWRKRLEPPATAARAEALLSSQADNVDRLTNGRRGPRPHQIQLEAPHLERYDGYLVSWYRRQSTCMVAWAAVSFSPFCHILRPEARRRLLCAVGAARHKQQRNGE